MPRKCVTCTRLLTRLRILSLGHMYKMYLKHKLILHVNLNSVLRISHYTLINTLKNPRAFLGRDTQTMRISWTTSTYNLRKTIIKINEVEYFKSRMLGPGISEDDPHSAVSRHTQQNPV